MPCPSRHDYEHRRQVVNRVDAFECLASAAERRAKLHTLRAGDRRAWADLARNAVRLARRYDGDARALGLRLV